MHDGKCLVYRQKDDKTLLTEFGNLNLAIYNNHFTKYIDKFIYAPAAKGTVLHMGMKHIIEAYQAACEDPRFDAELRSKDKDADRPELKGSIRLDIIKKDRSAIYEVKTGKAGYADRQIRMHLKHAPRENNLAAQLYELRLTNEGAFITPIDMKKFIKDE